MRMQDPKFDETVTENLISLGQQQVLRLLEQESIRWFVDANVLQSGFVERHIESFCNLFTIAEIETELLKRPTSAKSGLRVIERIKDHGNIISERHFEQFDRSFPMLMHCATQLAPSIRVRSQLIMKSESISLERAEEKAISQLAAEGDFLAQKMNEFLINFDFMEHHMNAVGKSTRRSWFRHPAKRRGKVAQDDFLQSDERLAGFALANMFLLQERTCILSNDTDFAAILKQFTDNLLWVASTIDCEISLGRPDLNSVIDLWESRCKDLDAYRERETLKLGAKFFEEEGMDIGHLLTPDQHELLVCRPDTGQISRFAFSEKVVRFIADFKVISLRLSLLKMGFWFP